MITTIRTTILALFIVLGLTATGFAPHAGAATAVLLSLSRGYAAPGDQVTVSGSGFHAGDSAVITVDFKVKGNTSRVQTPATVGGDGSLNASFTVPSGTDFGSYKVTAQDVHNSTGTATLHIVQLVWVQAGQNRGAVQVVADNGFYVSGAGFAGGEQVALTASFPLYSGNAEAVSKTVTADATGRLPEVGIQVPAGARAGSVVLTAEGVNSKKKGTARMNVVYLPSAYVQPHSVPPGGSFTVGGANLVPDSSVRIEVVIPLTNGVNQSFNRTVATNHSGAFRTSLDLPADTRPGTYTVTITDTVGGFHLNRSVVLAIHPGIAVQPSYARAGQNVTIKGAGFSAGAHITIVADFPQVQGGYQRVTRTVSSNGTGTFTTRITVPRSASSATVSVQAQGPNGKASDQLTVQASAPKPTATPKATVAPTKEATKVPGKTATPTPTATATPIPAPQATPTPVKLKKKGFGFRYVSLWYHTVRVGTWDEIQVKGSLKSVQGIWVHVIFPAGQHYDYYENTDATGFWQKRFTIPGNAISQYSSRGQIQIQLWHGKKSVKNFVGFTLTR